MKKVITVISIICICFNLTCYSRGGFGGFHAAPHSFHSSRSSSHSVNGKSAMHIGSSSHTHSIRSSHSVETGFHHSLRPVTFYRNNPSYRMVNNHYYPVYHRSPNYLFWYFVLANHRTHRNDTIRAKSKDELDKKVKSVSTEW
ncbi:MAG: hypothetical protein Q8904_03585 [Bacteroidota bacterium]|nr:hypothetical protein [Bacteroidota bacterium]